MVNFVRKIALFFTPWAACLLIILNVSKVESDVDPTTMVHDCGPPPEISPILPVVDPIGVINDPTVKPPPSYSILPVVDPISDPVEKPSPSFPPGVDPMPVIITPPYEEKVSIFYQKESQDEGLGIKMLYELIPGISEQDKMHITVSYDTGSSTAATFFAEQFTLDLFQELNKCDVIELNLTPCRKSQMKDGKLSCPTDEQCEVDKLHACVATTYNSDMPKLASFIISYFTKAKQAEECNCESQCTCEINQNYDLGKLTQAEQCACKDDPNHNNIIETCAQGEEGSRVCDFFYRSIHSEEPEVDPSYTNRDAIVDFKGTVCMLLDKAKLICGFCSP